MVPLFSTALHRLQNSVVPCEWVRLGAQVGRSEFTLPRFHQNISEGMEKVQLVKSVECHNYIIHKDLRFSEDRVSGVQEVLP